MKALGRKGRRRIVVILVAGVALILLGAFIAYGYIGSSISRAAKGRIYTFDENPPKTKVALVLGARVYKDGRLSTVLADRVDAGIALYRRGIVDKLLMSGDNRSANYNEVTAMRNYAIKHGIPSDDVVRDFAGFRTYDSIYRAKKLWNLDELIIASQQFHLPRSLYIAKSLGVDATGFAAVEKKYYSLRRTRVRERFAWMLAWLDVQLGRDAYFLGKPEGLSGDAQRTRVQD